MKKIDRIYAKRLNGESSLDVFFKDYEETYMFRAGDYLIHGGDIYDANSCVPTEQEFDAMKFVLTARSPTAPDREKETLEALKKYVCGLEYFKNKAN